MTVGKNLNYFFPYGHLVNEYGRSISEKKCVKGMPWLSIILYYYNFLVLFQNNNNINKSIDDDYGRAFIFISSTFFFIFLIRFLIVSLDYIIVDK